jgi:hypothetical protein
MMVLATLMGKLVHTSGFGCRKHRTTAFATLSGDCILHNGTCLANSVGFKGKFNQGIQTLETKVIIPTESF